MNYDRETGKPAIAEMHALADAVGVPFADLMFFIRGTREATALSFEDVVAWVEAHPAQCKMICQTVRADDAPALATAAAALDDRITHARMTRLRGK